MGLTDFRPGFRITADGNEATSVFRDRLVRLEVVDEAGLQSDMVEIELADTGPVQIALPRTGVELDIWLGYHPALSRMGLYIVDEVEMSGPPDRMLIRAHAAPHEATRGGKTDLQTQKSRSFPKGTTLGALVERIATDHGLEPAVAQDLAGRPLPHIDQVNESDMNLLLRVAGWFGAMAKPASGRMAVFRRGDSKSTGGAVLPVVALTPAQVSTWSARISRREPAKQVVAVWRDLEAGEDKEAVAGEGEPIRRMRQTFPDEETAKEAAEAELRRSERQGGSLSLTLPGRVDLMAEGRLMLTGFREGVAGEWLISRVTHTLDVGGYRCSVEAEWPG